MLHKPAALRRMIWEATFVVEMDPNELEIAMEIEIEMQILRIFGEAYCLSFGAAVTSWWFGAV